MSYLKFAHLLGLKKKVSEEEDDDKEKSKKAKSRRAEEECDDEEEAEDEDDRENMEEDDDPDAEDDEKEKGKKAKSRRAEDEDDDAEEDENRDVKKGRRAERKRCAAIFGSQHAAGRPDMAAHLAFNTKMSAREAIDMLATIGTAAPPKKGRMSLDERMRESEQARLGPDGDRPATGKNTLVSKMTRLYDTARGNK